jgi:hypothetical protein
MSPITVGIALFVPYILARGDTVAWELLLLGGLSWLSIGLDIRKRLASRL